MTHPTDYLPTDHWIHGDDCDPQCGREYAEDVLRSARAYLTTGDMVATLDALVRDRKDRRGADTNRSTAAEDVADVAEELREEMADDAGAAAIDYTDPDYLAWEARDQAHQDRTPVR